MQIAMAQARSTWFRVEVVVPFVQAFASFLPRSTTHLFSEERAAQHEGQVRAVPAHDGAVERLQHSHGVVRRGRATVRCCDGQPSHTQSHSLTLTLSHTHTLTSGMTETEGEVVTGCEREREEREWSNGMHGPWKRVQREESRFERTE